MKSFAGASFICRRLLGAGILFLVLAHAASSAEQWTITGRVIGISDGDTITVLDRTKTQHKIRLHGIDAPEKGQAFGDRSKESLSRLAFDRDVVARCHKRDRYGCQICKVMRGPVDLNIEQLRAGMAWWYREYAKEQSAEDRSSYNAAEEEARQYRVGLWKDAQAVAPWEWRKEPR